jgi:hypothetical protein
MLPRTTLFLTVVAGFCLPTAWADEAAPLAALSAMRVKEVTVFKDGHALMLHEGRMPVDQSGDVLLDSLPAPVLGTFWPYSAEKLVDALQRSRQSHLEVRSGARRERRSEVYLELLLAVASKGHEGIGSLRCCCFCLTRPT